RGRLTLLRIHLEEVRLERVHQRDVEPVLPDAGAAGALVAVVVPGPVRREHQVASVDAQLLAIDDGVGALALHDEAQRRRGVAMGRSRLAGQHDLDAGVQRADAGADVASGGFLRRDQLARAQHQRPHLPIAPEHRDRLRLGEPGLDVVGYSPETDRVHGLQLAVIGDQLRRVVDVGTSPSLVTHGLSLPSRSSHVLNKRPDLRLAGPPRAGSVTGHFARAYTGSHGTDPFRAHHNARRARAV